MGVSKSWLEMMIPLLTLCFAATVVLTEYNAPSILFRLYNGNISNYIEANINDAERTIFKSLKFDKTQKTVFIIHGFIKSADLVDVTLIADAFLKRGGINVIGVDWRVLAFYNGRPISGILAVLQLLSLINYPAAVRNTQIVSKDIATLINKLNGDNIMLIKELICVGHSLGAQICGGVGRNLGSQLPVIIGLDSATILFDNSGSYKALSRDDAKIVQLVHTDGGVIGTKLALGTASFYVNGGVRSQPGCGLLGIIEIACSHNRAYIYFAEAVLYPQTFPAVKCNPPSYSSNMENCNCSDYVYLGYPPDVRASGKYFMETNRQSPFGKGFDGIRVCNIPLKVNG